MAAHLIDLVFILGIAGGVYLGFKARGICREKNNGKDEVKS